LARVYQYCAEKYLQNSTNNYTEKSSIAVDVMKEKIFNRVEKLFREAPQEIQYFRNQILAGVYQCCAEKYLLYSANKVSDVNTAGQHLWMAICLYPQTLLKKYTQNLVKWFIKKWLIARFRPGVLTF
jgi:hypothetical protein